jgi:hypothetical protein
MMKPMRWLWLVQDQGCPFFGEEFDPECVKREFTVVHLGF